MTGFFCPVLNAAKKMPVDRILLDILSMSVEALDMLCAEVAEALAPRAWELKPDNFLVTSVIRIYPVSISDILSSFSGSFQTLIV